MLLKRLFFTAKPGLKRGLGFATILAPFGRSRQVPKMVRLALLLAIIVASAMVGPAHAQEFLPPPAGQPNPFAPLPDGTVIGPGGPMLPGPPPAAGNAVVIPPLDAEVVWIKLVDAADDYFKVRSEQRVVFANGVPTEGRIDTFPQTGATLLEPWRGDSVGWNERPESTLQSIRRIGTLRMSPDPNGWRVEVVVDKELEFMPRPMRATTGGATFRNDDSLYRYGTPLVTLGQQVGDQPRPVSAPTPNAGWIPHGRDPLLEKRILAKLLAKLGVQGVPQAAPYYEPPDSLVMPGSGSGVPAEPQAPTGPIYGAPLAPEQLPPGAVIAPGPPVPIESLPLPR